MSTTGKPKIRHETMLKHKSARATSGAVCRVNVVNVNVMLNKSSVSIEK